jgi:hypothetical protein
VVVRAGNMQVRGPVYACNELRLLNHGLLTIRNLIVGSILLVMRSTHQPITRPVRFLLRQGRRYTGCCHGLALAPIGVGLQ